MTNGAIVKGNLSILAFILCIVGLAVVVISDFLFYVLHAEFMSTWLNLGLCLGGIVIAGIGSTIAKTLLKNGEGFVTINKLSGIVLYVILAVVIISIILEFVMK